MKNKYFPYQKLKITYFNAAYIPMYRRHILTKTRW